MRLAALDLGTNSFHLLVAEVQPNGGIVPVVSEKEMLRLGDWVARTGCIPGPLADLAVTTVRRFRLIAESAGATEVHARATSALRTASNGDAVVDRIEREAGVQVDVITGLHEARLIFAAVRAAVLLEPAPAVCMDVGGGSVEIMVGDPGGLRWATSEHLGVGRLTAELVRSDPISKADRRALRAHVDGVLGPVADVVADFAPRKFVGSSGTLRDLARTTLLARGEELPLTTNQLTIGRDEFRAVHRRLLASTSAERRRMPGIEERRADLVPAGSVLLDAAFDLFGVDEMTVSDWALREGIVLDALGHHDPADWSGDARAIRRASVHNLARRCSWAEAHSRQVARLALALFDGTAELHGGRPDDRELLEYAALLHDIGEHVSSEGHHRHAAYLVVHGQLRGFDPEEVQILAATARWHRRGEPKAVDDLYGTLPCPALERVRLLTALLRVADGLDRSRTQPVRRVGIAVGPSLVLCRVDSDRDAELELWGARRKRDLFERVFDRELEVTRAPGRPVSERGVA